MTTPQTMRETMTKKRLKAPVALRGDVEERLPEAAMKAYRPVRAEAADTGSNTIDVFGIVGDEWFGVTDEHVSDRLRAMGDADEIVVNVNSPGGDFFAGVAIYNMLRDHDARVVANVVGLAGSAASIIIMAADEIRVSSTSLIFIHNTIGFVYGNKAEMTRTAQDLAKFDTLIASLYAERADMDIDDIISAMDDETFYTGKEAIENGLADTLTDDIEMKDDDADEDEKSPVARVDRVLAEKGVSCSLRRQLYAHVRDAVTLNAVRKEDMRNAVSDPVEISAQIREMALALKV